MLRYFEGVVRRDCGTNDSIRQSGREKGIASQSVTRAVQDGPSDEERTVVRVRWFGTGAER